MRAVVKALLATIAVVLGACGGGRVMMAPESPSAPASFAPGAEPEDETDGIWELRREGQPPILLRITGGAMTIVRPDATEELVWAEHEAPKERGLVAHEGEATPPPGSQCMEVVAVEAEALVVKMGTMNDGRCVLSEETLRFTRQTQR